MAAVDSGVPVELSQSEFNALAHAWCNAKDTDCVQTRRESNQSAETTITAESTNTDAMNFARAIEFLSSWDVQALPNSTTPSFALSAIMVPDAEHEISLLICLHPIYQVPVLLFDVRLLDGMPLSFEQVLQWLPDGFRHEHERLLQHVGPAHALLSQAEHPITHLPAWMVHPCCTAEWMSGFSSSSTKNTTTEPSDIVKATTSAQSRNTDKDMLNTVTETIATIMRTGNSISLVDDDAAEISYDAAEERNQCDEPTASSFSPSSSQSHTHNQAEPNADPNDNDQNGNITHTRGSLLLSWFSVTGPVVHMGLGAGVFAQVLALNRSAYEHTVNFQDRSPANHSTSTV